MPRRARSTDYASHSPRSPQPSHGGNLHMKLQGQGPPSSPAPPAASARPSLFTYAREGGIGRHRRPQPRRGGPGPRPMTSSRHRAARAMAVAMDVTSEEQPSTRQRGRSRAKAYRRRRRPGLQRRHPDRATRSRNYPLRRLEEDAGHPPGRRLPHHQGRAASTCTRTGSAAAPSSTWARCTRNEASPLKSAYVAAKHALLGLCTTCSPRKAANVQ
jgi:hypothetical protein